MLERHTINGASYLIIIFGYILLSLLVNLSFLLFIIISFSSTDPVSADRNVISIAAIVWYYIGLGIFHFIFGYRMLIWQKLWQETCGKFMAVLIIVFYPLFYLITLPMTVYYIFKFLGTPVQLWEKLIYCQSMSLENLTYARAGNYCILSIRFLTIGVLFGFFAIIYFVLTIAFCPIYYYLLAPFGFGPYGINIFFSLRHLDEFSFYSWDCIEKTHLYGIFSFGWAIALPGILFAIFYMIFVLVTGWQAILLLISSSLYFLIFGLLSTVTICCSRSFEQRV